MNIEETEQLAVRSTDGIINFVHWLRKPAIILNQEIDAIKKFLGEYENVQLEKIPVKHNDAVRITSGVFMGQEGHAISINNKTVKVHLPSLGFMMKAEVKISNIEVINLKMLSLPEDQGLQHSLG